VFGVNGQRIALFPFGRGADRTDQFHQGFGVTNARNIVERDGMFGQKCRGNDRQRRILVAGRLDRPRQPVAAHQ
jgi:hypothetical protein